MSYRKAKIISNMLSVLGAAFIVSLYFFSASSLFKILMPMMFILAAASWAVGVVLCVNGFLSVLAICVDCILVANDSLYVNRWSSSQKVQ